VIEKVTLGVMDSNAGARRLYRRLGFRAECRQRRYFKFGDGRYADDVVMSVYVKPGVAPAGFATWVVDRADARDSV
jgi:ribosomal protein S18 acetylase RimI-like enzyme